MAADPIHPAAVRPEWLFEVANRLQALAAPSGALGPSAGSAFIDFPPQSALEHELASELTTSFLEAHVGTPEADSGSPPDAGPGPPTPSGAQVVNRAQRLIQQDPSHHWTVESLARRVGRNRTDLESAFGRHSLQTVHEYLVLCRVDAAKVLLRTTAWRIEEIAKAVGYRSKVSLYTQFRRVLALTPDEYRLRWTGQPASTGVRERFHHVFSSRTRPNRL